MHIKTDGLESHHAFCEFRLHVEPLAQAIEAGVMQRGLGLTAARGAALDRSGTTALVVLDFEIKKDVWCHITAKVGEDRTTDTQVKILMTKSDGLEAQNFHGRGDAPIVLALDALEAYVRE